MPWSDWQDPYVISKQPVVTSVNRWRTSDGVHPSYNAVQVSSTYANATINIFEQKQTWVTPPPTYQALSQYSAPAGWQSERLGIPTAMSHLIFGVEYSKVPGQNYYVEYQAGPNTFEWSVANLNLTLNEYSGTPKGDFRVRFLDEVRFTTYGNGLPPSTWGTVDADSVVVATGTSATAVGANLGTIPLAGLEAFLLYVESDSTPTAMVRVHATPGQITANITTPQWRYWIPEVAYDNPTPPPTGVLRVMSVDVSGDVPVVDSVTRIRSDLYLASAGEVPNSLSIPSLNRVVVCFSDRFTLWTDDGVKVWEASLNDGDNYIGTAYSNPDDPTECAVVYDSARIFVITGLDTDTPVVDRVVANIPRFSSDWLTVSTSPYYLSHGLLNGDFEYEDDAPTNLLPWRNINEPGPDRLMGAFPSYYDWPAGMARWGRARDIHISEGGNIVADDEDTLTATITDYRDPDNLKTHVLEWQPADIIPNMELGGWNYSGLSAGSNTVSADTDGTRGMAIVGFTTVSDDIEDTTSLPPYAVYSDRYSVLLTLIQGPTTSPDTGGERVEPAAGPLVRGSVTLNVQTSHFWADQVNSYTPTLEVPPDANHIVVGDGLLVSEDNSAYLEFTATAAMNNRNAEDSIGGILPVPTLPPGHVVNGGDRYQVAFDIGFYSTVWRPGEPVYDKVYVRMMPVLPDGSLNWDLAEWLGEAAYTPGVWMRKQATYQYAMDKTTIDALMGGRLAVVAYPQGGGASAATLRVSYLGVTFATVGQDA